MCILLSALMHIINIIVNNRWILMNRKFICFLLSLLLIVAFIPASAFAEETMEAEPTDVITGFVPLETTDYYYEGSPEENDLTVYLPQTLGVYLNGSSQASEIPVIWEAAEDFDSTDFYYYSMRPIWSSAYAMSETLSEAMDVPWITVYRQEPENPNIEPIVSEEEAEPIYTEEEGSINPEEQSIQDAVEDTAKAAVEAFTDKAYAATSENTAAVYKYLTNTMKLNTAAACGVMANLNAESAMSSINLQNTYNALLGLSDSKYTSRVNAGKGKYKTGYGTTKYFNSDSAGYGLCQWTSSGRKAALLDRAISKGSSIGSRSMQLGFLNTELKNSYPSVYNTLKSVPNTAGGAYIAAVQFCLCFEIPANTVNTSISRGRTCLLGYWDKYGSESANKSKSYISLCAYSYPESLKTGKGVDVKGNVISNYNITNVTAKILTNSGTVKYRKTVKPYSTIYKLTGMDDAMKFSKLSAGTYKYVIYAEDSKGKSVSVVKKFSVSASKSTITDLGFAMADYTAPPSKKHYTGTYPKIPKRGYFKKGDKGTQVRYLQKYLKWYGYNLKADGHYGTKTAYYVKKFQKVKGLKASGCFGPKSLAKAKLVKR